MLYGQPFLLKKKKIVVDLETVELVKYLTNLDKFQLAIQTIKPSPSSTYKGRGPSSKTQRTGVNKNRKEGSTEDQLRPKWKGLYQVILATPHSYKSSGDQNMD